MQSLPSPLNVLIIDSDDSSRNRLRRVLARNQFVERIQEVKSIKQAIDFLGKEALESINCIFIDPLILGLNQATQFIFKVRKTLPHVVFCLYLDRSELERQAPLFYEGERSRFHHYYTLDKELEDAVLHSDAANVVFLCISDVRVFSEIERLRLQRNFYLDAMPPAEISESLRKFRQKYSPDTKIAFIIMKFGDHHDGTHDKIYQHIKDTLKQFGFLGVRADEHDFHETLLHNVQTYLHGCDFGIVVFERIHDDSVSPNVAFEAGYLNALRKPICYLKDQSLKVLPSDLLNSLYVEFDTRHLRKTIKKAIREWVGKKALNGNVPPPDAHI